MLPTRRGVGLLLATALLIAVSVWVEPLRWVALGYFACILALWGLDWQQAQTAQRFEITRRHDTKLNLAAANSVHLSVRNRAPRPATFQLRDEAPEAFEIEARVFQGRASGFGEWTHTYTVRPRRRGDYAFGDVHLRWLGPLGLVWRQGRVPLAAPVKVYPNLLDVRRYDLLLRRNRLQELGLRHTRLTGEGTEFERLREYSPDDEFRRINWKATARRNRPVTVEHQTERSQSIFAVLDAGRMMQSPVAQIAKLDYVVNAALLLAYVAVSKGDKMGLMTFADDVSRYLAPKQGRGQFYRMLELLYAVEPQPVEPDYRRALSYLALKHRKRALVVIFTDLSGGLSMQALVAQMAVLSRYSLPLVVTISDPDVVAAAHQMPTDSATAYQRVAAAQLLEERQLALDHLRRQGVLTLDVPANQLSVAVIDKYLDLKARTQL